MPSLNARILRWGWLLLLFVLTGMGALKSSATDQKKTSTPPPKTTQTAKPAAQTNTSRPAGGGATMGGSPSHGGLGGGPSANHPVGPSTNHPTGPSPRNFGTGGFGPDRSHNPPQPLVGRGGRPVNSDLYGRPAPSGVQQVRLRDGSAIERRPDGRPRNVHIEGRGMEIHHGLNGGRRVLVERPDHSRVFAERGRPGYIQRPYRFHDHDFARRSYYYHGRMYDRFYRGYYYRGVYIHAYAPVRYYSIGFYGWVYNPWYQPVVYSWGWAGTPWFTLYGGYFTPYPAYPNASLWLTDYMISADLQAEYQAAQEAQQSAVAPTQAQSGVPALTPEVKQQIADEVRSQIALENSEAQQNAQHQDPDPLSSGIARMMSDGHPHVFLVGTALDVVDASGAECALSGGDVLSVSAAPDPNATAVDLVVLSSKGGTECQRADTVTVALNDLQEMQNHMRETIDQGLQDLQTKQGNGGIPKAPPSAQTPPVATEFAQAAPPPDPNGAAEVNQQLQDADAAEKGVVTQAQVETGTPAPQTSVAQPVAPPAVPTTVELGETVDQVTGAMGQPTRIFDLGTKKILQYPNMKITFKDGKVVDVE